MGLTFRGMTERSSRGERPCGQAYEYDAWGNHKVQNVDKNNPIGDINPFRYRGYYYDTYVKMYYLQTRWYDPEVGRFINLDQISYLDPETVNGLDLYAYCYDNPVNYIDSYGHFAIEIGGFVILGGIVLLLDLLLLESETHVVEEVVDDFVGGIGDLFEGSNESIFDEYQDSTSEIEEEQQGNVALAYLRKPVAPRIRFNTKKKAKQAAFYKGGKKNPRHDPHDKYGRHYNPVDPRFKHWHYYYSFIIWRLRLENYE